MAYPSDSWHRRGFLRAAVGGSVAAGLWGCSLPSFFQRFTDTPLSDRLAARGTVTSQGRPLPGVRVSDGLHVSTTTHRGEFEIPLYRESGPFVFVVTPSGFWAERFWAPIYTAAREPVHFELEPRPPQDRFDFVFMTDLHLGDGDTASSQRSLRRLDDALESVRVQGEHPAFLWIGGDASVRTGWGPRVRRRFETLGLPHRFCIGDHELHAGRPDPRDEYHYFFGPSYYSFDWGRVHFVAIDGCKLARQRGDAPVQAELSPRLLRWLEEDLQLVPEGMPTVVATHMPIVSTHAERRGASKEAAGAWVCQNAPKALDLLARYRVPLVLQGHLHENERILVGATEFVSTVSVSGPWWQAEDGALGVSGEPRGYRRVEVDGLRIAQRFVPLDGDRREPVGEVVGAPDVLPRAAAVPIFLNLYDTRNDARVQGHVDDSPWEPLALYRPEGAVEGLRMAHHWLWKVDTREWKAGPHRLEFRIQESSEKVLLLEHSVEII